MTNPIDNALRETLREVIADRGAYGIDMTPDEAAAFVELVLCDAGQHLVQPGEVCPECHPNTTTPEE